MSFAMSGLTHCKKCWNVLEDNEFGLCKKCKKEKKMNKKIKVIELFELISNNKQIPQKILYDNEEYVFNGESFVCCDHDTTPLLGEYNKSRLIDFLNDEVEILEDNTEEIEELEKEREVIANPKTMMQEIRFYYDSNKMGDKINELVKAVNSIRKDKSND